MADNPIFHVSTDAFDLSIDQGVPPNDHGFVFLSTDVRGTPGTLNGWVQDVLETSFPINEKNLQSNGFDVAHQPKKPIGVWVVTVGYTGPEARTPTENLQQNLLKAMYFVWETLDRSSFGPSLWIPLMATGAGGLSYVESARITLSALAEFSRARTELRPHIQISVPSDANDGDMRGLQTIANELFEKTTEPANEPTTDVSPGFLADRPIKGPDDDSLNRTAIARALANAVRDVWGDHTTQTRPFALHLAGRWGSGKSSVLSLFQTELETPNDGAKPWLVVPYNAWQRQNDGATWWGFMNAVVNTAATSRTLSPQRRQRTKWGHRWWRWTRGTFYGWWLLLLLLGGFSLYYVTSAAQQPPTKPSIPYLQTDEYITTQSNANFPSAAPGVEGPFILEGAEKRTTLVVTEDKTEQPDTSDHLSAFWKSLLGFSGSIIALAGTLAGLFGVISNLLNRRANTANALTKLDFDPNKPLHDRFAKVIKDIDQPVAIFIDDADRCNAEYLVNLLECTQTIYADVPVLYVIAGDRNWIVSAYEQVYSNFSKALGQPGQPLGHLFLEKMFQLSVHLPDLSQSNKNLLLTDYLGETQAEEAEIDDLLAQVASADGDVETLRSVVAKASDSGLGTKVGSAAFEALSTATAQAQLRHVLRDFVGLMSPNPRAMKRLLNDYTFRQGFLFLAGITVPTTAIVHWVILNQRFPYAAAAVAEDPDLLENAARVKFDQEERSHFGPLFDHKDISTLLDPISESDLGHLNATS